jgi:hypothetical protein
MDSAKKLVFTAVPDLLKELAPNAGAATQVLLAITPDEAGPPLRLRRQQAAQAESSSSGGDFDLATLYESWRDWAATDRLNVNLT